MLNVDIIREEYGFLGERIHLNSCSVGVPSRRVQNACKSFYGRYMDLVYGDIDGYAPLRADVREKAARFLGCRPEEIAFSGSTTEGLCTLAAGYPLGPGDNVLTCDLENPAAMLPWLNAAKNRGFELRIAKSRDGKISPDALLALADAGTKIICISAVQYGTGFFADLKAIGAACRERGVLFAVDAIQALGRMKIDVEAMAIDYLSCGGFKGLGAGFGIGIIYCSNRVIRDMAPAYAGVSSVTGTLSAPQVFDPFPSFAFYDDARRLEAGSHNTLGNVLLDASLGLFLDLGIEEIQGHILTLENRLRLGLQGTLLRFPGPDAPENRSGIIVMYYPETLFPQVDAILAREGIILTSDPGYIRLCLHCFNTEAQIDVVIQAFAEISELIASQEAAS